MSIATYNVHVISRSFVDQTADEILHIMKAPFGGMTILAAYAIADATFDADGSNYYTVSLIDGGADGTGTTSMGSVGGASVDWTADTAKTLTLTQTGLDEGDWLHVKYDEEGTVAPGEVTICIHWTQGGT